MPMLSRHAELANGILGSQLLSLLEGTLMGLMGGQMAIRPIMNPLKTTCMVQLLQARARR